MTDETPKIQTLDTDHVMSHLVGEFYHKHYEFCAEHQISPWDLCCIMANVQALIFANSPEMPRKHALKRFKELEKLMRVVYDTSDTRGTA